MDYPSYVNQIAALLDVSATITNAASSAPFSVADYNTLLPQSIDWVENRMRRDLDFLATITTDETGTLTASSRNFTYPTANSASFIVVEQLYLIVTGVRQSPMYPVSLEFLNAAYPSDTPLSPTPSYPQYWAPFNSSAAVLGPAPDSTYGVGIVGTKAPIPLSASATSNWFSVNVPDLYIAGAMVFWSGAERQYGAQADNAQGAVSWEGQYQAILKGATVEERRKAFQSQGWGARLPSPLASPPQT